MLTTYHNGTNELVLWIFNLLTQADSYADEALNNTSVIILRCQYQNNHFRHRSYLRIKRPTMDLARNLSNIVLLLNTLNNMMKLIVYDAVFTKTVVPKMSVWPNYPYYSDSFTFHEKLIFLGLPVTKYNVSDVCVTCG